MAWQKRGHNFSPHVTQKEMSFGSAVLQAGQMFSLKFVFFGESRSSSIIPQLIQYRKLFETGALHFLHWFLLIFESLTASAPHRGQKFKSSGSIWSHLLQINICLFNHVCNKTGS